MTCTSISASTQADLGKEEYMPGPGRVPGELACRLGCSNYAVPALSHVCSALEFKRVAMHFSLKRTFYAGVPAGLGFTCVLRTKGLLKTGVFANCVCKTHVLL